MAQSMLKRGIAAALVFSLSTVAACGDDAGSDTPGPGTCDPQAADQDCDKDGLTRGYELANGLNPDHPDTDGNGFIDAYESGADGMPHIALQEIGNGSAGALEDADGDGILNLAEAWNSTIDTKTGALTRVWNAATANAGFQCSPDDSDAFFHDMAFRFNSLKLTEPGILGQALSGIMGADIQSGLLNVVADVHSFDNANCVSLFTLSAGSGVALEGEGNYEVEACQNIEEVRAVAVQTGPDTAFFRTIEPLTVIFPGIMPSTAGAPLERFILPLRRINAAGIMTRSETGLDLSAMIDGSINFEDAQNTTIRMQADAPEKTIYELLIAEKRYYYSPGETEPMGFVLRGTFTANQISLAPMPEPTEECDL